MTNPDLKDGLALSVVASWNEAEERWEAHAPQPDITATGVTRAEALREMADLIEADVSFSRDSPEWSRDDSLDEPPPDVADSKHGSRPDS